MYAFYTPLICSTSRMDWVGLQSSCRWQPPPFLTKAQSTAKATSDTLPRMHYLGHSKNLQLHLSRMLRAPSDPSRMHYLGFTTVRHLVSISGQLRWPRLTSKTVQFRTKVYNGYYQTTPLGKDTWDKFLVLYSNFVNKKLTLEHNVKLNYIRKW